MTSAIRILLTYAIGGFAGFALYVALFALPIGGEILFYRGLLMAIIAAAVIALAIIGGRRWLRVDLATGIGLVLTSLAANVCFLVLFPVTIDRSISVFLLSRIAAEEPLSTAELQDRFANEYLGTMRQIPRRVREQTISGNVTVDRSGAISLTPGGRRFVALAKAASTWFHTDPRFVESDARTTLP